MYMTIKYNDKTLSLNSKYISYLVYNFDNEIHLFDIPSNELTRVIKFFLENTYLCNIEIKDSTKKIEIIENDIVNITYKNSKIESNIEIKDKKQIINYIFDNIKNSECLTVKIIC